MRLNELSDNPGATKARLRVGRGVGSGKGKTAGRGVKGQKSRSGVAIKGFEGGQMPIHMRLPKRGFNKPNRKRWAELSIATLERAVAAGKLDLSKDVDAAALVKAGVLRRAHDGVRLIGSGKLSKGVNLTVAGATPGATKIVEGAGGSVNVSDDKPVRVKADKPVRLKKAAAPKSAPKKPAAEKKAAAPKKAAPVATAAPKAEKPKVDDAAKAQAEPKVLYTDGATDGEPDDLKKIKGIGPKFEKDLNGKGVYYFRQIAAWKPADVEMVDKLIESFPGRIERDEWVRQAGELASNPDANAKKKTSAKKTSAKKATASKADKPARHVEYWDATKTFDADADEDIVRKITNYCGIALNSRDGKYVACSDEEERNTVRDGFLKKKLELKGDDAELDAKVKAVCEEMKPMRMKNRVTFYYLLAKNEDMLSVFEK